MSSAVVDASALVSYYSFNDPRRVPVVERLASGDTFFAPVHLDVEVVAALWRLARVNTALRDAAPTTLKHLAGFSIRRTALATLLPRMWELRHNVTPYDAAYVALAEALSCPLVTCDAKLASATGTRCEFELID